MTPLEILLAAATLLGGIAAIGYGWDKWRGKDAKAIARLERRLSELLEQRSAKDESSTASGQPSVPPPAASALKDRIAGLLSQRRRLLKSLAELAKARGLRPPAENLIDSALAELTLPQPLEGGVRSLLAATDRLERKSAIDIEHSDWVAGMTDAAVDFLGYLGAAATKKEK